MFMQLGKTEPVRQQRNVLVFEDANLSPVRQTDPEDDLWRVNVRCKLDYGCDTTGVFTNCRGVHLLPEEFVAELLQ